MPHRTHPAVDDLDRSLAAAVAAYLTPAPDADPLAAAAERRFRATRLLYAVQRAASDAKAALLDALARYAPNGNARARRSATGTVVTAGPWRVVQQRGDHSPAVDRDRLLAYLDAKGLDPDEFYAACITSPRSTSVLRVTFGTSAPRTSKFDGIFFAHIPLTGETPPPEPEDALALAFGSLEAHRRDLADAEAELAACQDPDTRAMLAETVAIFRSTLAQREAQEAQSCL